MKYTPVLILIAVALLPARVRAETESPYKDMWGQYEAIRQLLLQDSIDGVATHAEALTELTRSLQQDLSADTAGVAAPEIAKLETALGQIETSAQALARGSGLDSARQELFALTRPLAQYRKLVGDEETIVAYCPMAQKAWIQPEGELGNPYMGQKMPKCGEVVGE